MRIDFAGEGLSGGPGFGLGFQFLDGGATGARHGLVGAGNQALDLRGLMDGHQRHQRNDGTAVRVGDEPLVLLEGFRIDFRDHQGDAGIHAEVVAIVHHDTAPFDRFPSERL